MALTITYPLTDDVKSNFLFNRDSTTKDSLKSKLLFLLLTQKGNRFRRRNFGVNLIQMLFEPNDVITKSDVVNEIKNKAKIYIPELEINNVDFIEPENDSDKNILTVNIRFTYIQLDGSQDEINIDFQV